MKRTGEEGDTFLVGLAVNGRGVQVYADPPFISNGYTAFRRAGYYRYIYVGVRIHGISLDLPELHVNFYLTGRLLCQSEESWRKGMKIYCYENGPFMVNTYLVVNETDNRGIVIDPGHNISGMLKRIRDGKIAVDAILATHGHIDHVAGVSRAKKELKVKFYCNVADRDMLEMIPRQASMFGVPDTGVPVIDQNLPGTGTISMAGLELHLFHTPGHSAGSVSIRIGSTLFSGDTLFNFSIGRTDLPGGSYPQLINSIRTHIFTLPDDVAVYPGHGPATTVGHEKRYNPFFN